MFGRNKWKKQYDESKFDLIDMKQFRTVSFKYVTSYFFMYISIIIALAVFASDIYTAVVLLAFDRWSSEIDPAVPIHISRWIFAGCIILSTVLIAIEFIIAIRVAREQNISRTYTNEIARKFYSIKGYNYFCLFGKITKSRNKKEYLALFVYFALKGWVRLIFAEGPRQAINALTLYSVFKVNEEFLETLKDIALHSHAQALVIAVMVFSLVVWLANVFQLIFALLCALPLYVHIEKTCSGLEEYCYVRINKRIAMLVKKYHDRDLMELREQNKRKSKQPTLPVFLNQKDSDATLVDSRRAESKKNLLNKNDTEVRSFAISSADDIRMPSQKKLDSSYDQSSNGMQYRTEADQSKRKVPERFPINPVQRKPVGSTTKDMNSQQMVPRSTTAPPGRNLTGVSSATQQQSRPAQSNNQRPFDQTQPSYSVNNLPKPSDYEPRSKTAPLPKQQAQAAVFQQDRSAESSKSIPEYSVNNLQKSRDYAPRSKTTPPQQQPAGTPARPQEYNQVEPSYSVHNLPRPSDYNARSQTAPPKQQPPNNRPQEYNQVEPSYSVHNLPRPSDYNARSQTAPPKQQPPNNRSQEYNQVEPSYSVHNLPKPSDYNARSQTAPLPRQQSNTPYTQSSQHTHTISTVGAQQPVQFQSASQQLLPQQQQQQHNEQFSSQNPVSSTLPQSYNLPTHDNEFSPQMHAVLDYDRTTRSDLPTSLSTTQGDFNPGSNYYSEQSFNMASRSNTDPTLEQTVNPSYTVPYGSRSVTVPPPNLNGIDPAKQERIVNSPNSNQPRFVMQAPTNTPMSEHFELPSNPFETAFPSQSDHERNGSFSAPSRSMSVPPEFQTNYEGISNNFSVNNNSENGNIMNNQSSSVSPPPPLSREDFSSSSHNSQSNPFMSSTLDTSEMDEHYAGNDVPPGSVALDHFYSGGDFNKSSSTLLGNNDHYHDHANDIFALYYPSEAMPGLVYNGDLASTPGADSIISQQNDQSQFKLPYPENDDSELEAFLSAGSPSVDEKKSASSYPDYGDDDDHNPFEEHARPNGVLPYPETDVVEELVNSTQYSDNDTENNNGDYNVQTTTSHGTDNGRLNNNGNNASNNINFSNGNPGTSEEGSNHSMVNHMPYSN